MAAFTYYFYRWAGLIGTAMVLGAMALDMAISPLIVTENHSVFLGATLTASCLAALAAKLDAIAASPVLLLLSMVFVFVGDAFAIPAVVGYISDAAVCWPLSADDISSGHACVSSAGTGGVCSMPADSHTHLSDVCLEVYYGSGLLGRLAHGAIGVFVSVGVLVLATFTYVFVRDYEHLKSLAVGASALLVASESSATRRQLRDALLNSGLPGERDKTS